MKYRRFGKTELQVPVFTFGAMRIPGVPEEEALKTIFRAVELGITHLETARGYGSSEELLGKAMPHLRREDLIITTKIPPTETADEMRRFIEESLQRMNISRIDNFDLHGINTPELLERSVRRGGCMDAVRKAQEEGIIGHVGFSTHAPLQVILDAIETREFESVNLHYYYFNQRNLPAVRRAYELDMGVLIISPTDKGGQLFRPTQTLRDLTAPLTPIQANARWLLAQPEVSTLTLGAAHPEEFDEHIAVADRDGPLTEEEQQIFQRLEERFRMLGPDRCTVCHECLPCPEGINIPEVLRLRNMAVAFDMVDFGKYRYNLFENAGHWFPGSRADRCTECGDCLPRCPEKLDIPRLLFETHEMLAGEPGKRMWGT
ncbi:MAG: aldo/keto reductase [Armatimonadota bacterium]